VEKPFTNLEAAFIRPLMMGKKKEGMKHKQDCEKEEDKYHEAIRGANGDYEVKPMDEAEAGGGNADGGSSTSPTPPATSPPTTIITVHVPGEVGPTKAMAS